MNWLKQAVSVTLRVTISIRFLEEKNSSDCLRDLFSLQNASLLEESHLVSTSLLNRVYDILRFEPLHNLYLGMSNLLDEYSFKFLGSDKLMRKPNEVSEHRKLLSRMRVSVLHGVNFLFAEIDRDASVPRLRVECFYQWFFNVFEWLLPKQCRP